MWLCRRRNKQNLFGDFGQLPRRTPRGGSIDGAHAAHRAARAPSKTEILYDSPAPASLRAWRLCLRSVGLGGGSDGGSGRLGGSNSVAALRRSAQFAATRQSPAKGGKSAARGSPVGWLLVLLVADPRLPAPKSPNLIRRLTPSLNAGRFLCRGRAALRQCCGESKCGGSRRRERRLTPPRMGNSQSRAVRVEIAPPPAHDYYAARLVCQGQAAMAVTA